MIDVIYQIKIIIIANPLIIILYYSLLNLLAFIVMGLDKYKAKKHLWRISENALLLFAMLGGALGSFLGMKIFHHKTQKMKFTISVPVFFFIHLMLILTILSWRGGLI